MWQTPIPYQNTADTPNIGTWAQTEDTRIGMGLEGLLHLRKFIDAGGVVHRVEQQRRLRDQQQLHLRRHLESPGDDDARRRLAAAQRSSPTTRARSSTACPTTSPSTATPARRSASARRPAAADAARGGGGGGGAPAADAAAAPAAGRPGAARRTIPTSSRDAALVEGTNLTPVPAPQPVQPWQYAIPTEEALKRQPGERDSAEVPPARAAALRRAEHAARVGPARRRRRHRAAAGRRRRAGRQGTRRAVRRPIRSIAARRSAATSWCSTPS